MDPLTLLAWVAVISLAVVIVAIALLVVWTVIQTMRGKGSPRKTRILG